MLRINTQARLAAPLVPCSSGRLGARPAPTFSLPSSPTRSSTGTHTTLFKFAHRCLPLGSSNSDPCNMACGHPRNLLSHTKRYLAAVVTDDTSDLPTVAQHNASSNHLLCARWSHRCRPPPPTTALSLAGLPSLLRPRTRRLLSQRRATVQTPFAPCPRGSSAPRWRRGRCRSATRGSRGWKLPGGG